MPPLAVCCVCLHLLVERHSTRSCFPSIGRHMRIMKKHVVRASRHTTFCQRTARQHNHKTACRPEGGSGAHAVRTWCAEYLQQVALVAIRRLCSSTLAPRRLSATNSVHVASSIIRSPQAISQRLSKPEHMSMITEISTRSSGTGRLGPWPASSNETAWSPDPRQLAARVRRTPPALLPSAARGCGRHALHACPRIAGEGGGGMAAGPRGRCPGAGPRTVGDDAKLVEH